MTTFLDLVGFVLLILLGLAALIIFVSVLAYLVAKMWTLGRRKAELTFRDLKKPKTEGRGQNGHKKGPPFGA